MEVRILCFASTQDVTGQRELTLQVPDSATAGGCLEALKSEYPALGPILGRCRIAVNDEFASESDAVSDGDTLALLPPMSGG